MPRIRVLSPHIANQIAAGEVVERPASVVKELVENAVDAGATSILIEAENGGVDCIRVADNGCGIPAEDCPTAFLRHATSKLQTADDLSHIESMGFRGEALASIAAVSRATLTTRSRDEAFGVRLRVDAGQACAPEPIGCAVGTTLEVRSLFYNAPARLKFLKSARTEAGAIGDYVARMLMAHPEIAFHYRHNGRDVYETYGDGSLKYALLCVYGADVLPGLCEVLFDDGYLRIQGFIGASELARLNRSQQSFFLNRRYIRSNALSFALQRAYDTRLLSGRFPFAVLNLTLSSAEVDVNVHPTKLEVRFADEARICRSLTAACTDALIQAEIPSVVTDDFAPERPTPRSTMRGNAPQPTGSSQPPRIPDLRTRVKEAAPRLRESAPVWAPVNKATLEKEPWPRYSITPRAEGQRKAEAALKEDRAARTPEPLSMSSRDAQEAENASKPASAGTQAGMFAEPYHIVGLLFSTYWVVQQGEYAYLIDQHAAHERSLYELLVSDAYKPVSQKLLFPRTLTLQPSEESVLEDARESFAALGFELCRDESGKLLLASCPTVHGILLEEAYLYDAIHALQEGDSVSLASLCREKLMQTACKHAVKAGEPIAKEELASLLQRFADDSTPLTCPHGRPVMVRVKKAELEKLFLRVQ